MLQVLSFKTMRIGCDLDDVIINHSRNRALLLKKRGFVSANAGISKKKAKELLGAKEYLALQKELYGAISLEADEVLGAKKCLKGLLEKGHEIRIISRRSKGSRKYALSWLKNNGFFGFFPSSRVHFVDADKEKDLVCKKFGVDLHIDDSPEVFKTMTFPRYKILFGHNHGLGSAEIFSAKTWDVALEFVKKTNKL